MERSEADKKKGPDSLSHPNQNTIINKILKYVIRYGKSTMIFN